MPYRRHPPAPSLRDVVEHYWNHRALRQIALVTVPVTDQDAAKTCYVDRLGFTERFDYRMDAETAGSAGRARAG